MSRKKLLLLFWILLNFFLVFVLADRINRPVSTQRNDSEDISFEEARLHISNTILGNKIENAWDVDKVKKVIDGDTILLESGKTVRYIGIDSPEVSRERECFAIDAKNRNSELVLGKLVRLEKDVSEVDRYGRYLRYVYVGDTFINKTLVLEGYAKAYTYPPDIKYSELFRKAENEARINNRGLWGKCKLEIFSTPVELNE